MAVALHADTHVGSGRQKWIASAYQAVATFLDKLA